MSYVDEKSSQIEREIEQDRRRIEERIGAIQDRLSPGQLIDEMLAYAKGHGGGEFVSNLKTSAVTNPLPVALIGVGLAWLMAKPATPSQQTRASNMEYPLAPVTGEVRRSRSSVTDGDYRYSHFEDSSGKKFKALADESGRRAGHFIDESGNMFRGFADASGRQIDRITDEAGNLLDEASGWAQRAWAAVSDAVGDAKAGISSQGASISDRASGTFASMQHQSARFNEMVQTTFRDQPLIGGALAFAFGAAMGAALPRTPLEDSVLGHKASEVKSDLMAQADQALDKGAELASAAYESAAEVASEIHDTARERIGEKFGQLDNPSERSSPRHH